VQQPCSNALSERLFQSLRGLLLHIGQDVRVDVQVMLIEECPSISETTLAFTSRPSSSVAHVWRRSWKRISGSPARFRSGLKERLRRFEGLMMVPLCVAKMSPPGWKREPIASISRSWQVRCTLSASTAPDVSLMVRRLFFVFGFPRTKALSAWVSVRRTRRTPRSRSTSSHLRASSSPWRIPVLSADTQELRACHRRPTPGVGGPALRSEDRFPLA
jgi:hypothetical protein